MPDRKKKVAILTLGCRVNQSESSVIEGTLKRRGISIVGLDDSPDYCIVNTCTVTGKSDASSRHLIRKAVRSHAEVIVTGCFSELNHGEVAGIPGVSNVIPTSKKEKIIKLILGSETEPVFSHHNRARPYLKVQDGCNFSCTYCAVPMARGKSRSLDIEEAVRRAVDIESQGYHEIVLTGIHLGGFGQDLSPKTSLAQLIARILATTSACRIRLSSIEINELDDELIEIIGDPRICKHLHLPMQSGSDFILKRMNRNYSTETYIRKLLRLHELSSDIALGTDIIVGFPGEGDKEFAETSEIVRELPFSYLHVFPYSKRGGTLAANLKPQIAGDIISNRVKALKVLADAKRTAFASAQIDKVLDAIADEADNNGNTTLITSNYLKITITGSRLAQGSAVFVRSLTVSGDRLTGVMIT